MIYRPRGGFQFALSGQAGVGRGGHCTYRTGDDHSLARRAQLRARGGDGIVSVVVPCGSGGRQRGLHFDWLLILSRTEAVGILKVAGIRVREMDGLRSVGAVLDAPTIASPGGVFYPWNNTEAEGVLVCLVCDPTFDGFKHRKCFFSRSGSTQHGPTGVSLACGVIVVVARIGRGQRFRWSSTPGVDR